MDLQKIFYGSADGASNIHACIWKPSEDVQVKGVIQIVHGMSEHILRYGEFAKAMTEAGFIVCGNDHLGHGKSANGNFGYIGVGGHRLLAKDVYKLTNIVKKEFELPVVLIGLGIGSLIARYVSAVWNMEYAGAIFSGTSGGGSGLNFLHRVLSKMKYGSTKKGVAKEASWINKQIHGKYNRGFRHSDHGPSWLSRDVYQVSAFEADPLCGFPLTYGACMDFLKLNRIVNSAGWPMRIEPQMPIFIFSGLNDPMGDFGKGVIKVYGDLINAGCENVHITLYQEARHEMLFELNRKEVFADVAKWASDVCCVKENLA
ncbi:MAG: alpha/beta hydrolase [Defluviitaleaceae bacterium]|nr:alpha/beta hydrolase [Defluviitaleaceae bacterium]